MPRVCQPRGWAGASYGKANAKSHAGEILVADNRKLNHSWLGLHGFYYLRLDKTGQFQGCGVSHSRWLPLSPDQCGFPGSCCLQQAGGGRAFLLFSSVCVQPSPGALSTLHFKPLRLKCWQLSWSACKGNGMPTTGLDQWRFPMGPWHPAGHRGVISESFPLLCYTCLITHQVFSNIPLL